MKLVNKFAFWYLGITSVVLVVGGVIVFRSVQNENDEEEARRLRAMIADVVSQLEKNVAPESLRSDHIAISERSPDQPLIKFNVKDTLSWHSESQGTERQLKASQSHSVRGIHFLIAARSFAPEPEETITGVIRSLSWIFLLLLIVVALTSILISKKILSPFYESLHVIQNFSLKQKQKIKLSDTHTAEFRELNLFLQKMTSKALEDYRALKEFSENASHELQTPVAIIRGKLELLLESGVSKEQASLVMSAYESVERLSKTNQSLILLTRLENHEYEPRETIDFSKQVRTVLASLSELIAIKSLTLESSVEENVKLSIDHALADIMLMNLLSNAIRHNLPGGRIKVSLHPGSLVIQNTGTPPQIPTDQLFQRFKKDNQSSDSVGLGLSIVKRICEVSRLEIAYTFQTSLHVISIVFNGR